MSKLCIFNLSNPRINFSRFCLPYILFFTKGTVVILPMNHRALVCTNTKRQSRSGLTHPHDTFFTAPFISAREAEAAGKSLHATNASCHHLGKDQQAARLLCWLFSLLIMKRVSVSGSAGAVNTSLRPSSHRLESFSIRNIQFVCFHSTFQVMTSTPSANL